MTRVIAVAVTGSEADLAALRWVAAEVDPGDAVHVVHAYALLSFAESSWRPAVAANDERRARARRVVAASVQCLHELNPAVVADGSAIAGRPLSVLADMSTIVDLLVLAERATFEGTRIAPALSRRSRCPIAVIPLAAAPAPDGPVALLLDRTDLPNDVVELAFREAAHRTATLVVAESVQSRSEPSSPDENSAFWEQVGDTTLHGDLARWQEKFRDSGVIVELRREPPSAAARLLEHTAQLIVVPRGGRGGGALGPAAAAALRRAACPVLVVPETAAADAVPAERAVDVVT